MPFETAINDILTILKPVAGIAVAAEMSEEQESFLERTLEKEGFENVYVKKAFGYNVSGLVRVDYTYCIATRGF